MKNSCLFFASLYAVFLFLCVGDTAAQEILKKSDVVTVELKTPAEDAASVSSTYSVSEAGTLRLPMLATEIPVSGLSVAAVARKIEAAYRAEQIYTNPAINVLLNTTPGGISHAIVVGGEVKQPGEFALREGMTLMAAISRAGGFDTFANPKRVKLIRGGKEQTFDCRTIDPRGSNNPVLTDDDLIIVGKD